MTPLEIWDLRLGERVLWDVMLEPDFPAILAQAIAGLRRGEGETRREGRVPAAIAGFDSLFVAGRRSNEPAIRASLRMLGVPVAFSRTPDYPGCDEGLRLLRDMAGANGWICDLGQTAIKLVSRTQRASFPRDFARLPIGADGGSESVGDQRGELRRWLTESLRTFAARVAPPDALLFALPSRLDDEATPEGSSYVGMAGDRSLPADVMQTLGFRGPRPRVLVLNDAELAALEAQAQIGDGERSLVITLGFGVGAALVSHRNRS